MIYSSNITKEFSLSHLEESDLTPDPFKQFENWLEEAIASDHPEPNAMSLSTVDKQGKVSVRMMVCKAIDERGFHFVTNYNSAKGQALTDHPQAALLFWWPLLERQVRVTGITQKMTPLESDHYFFKREYESQLSAILSKQSQVLSDKQQFIDEYEHLRDSASKASIQRPIHWGGFILVPTEFEFWQGGLHRLHDRFCYKRPNEASNAWDIVRLYP